VRWLRRRLEVGVIGRCVVRGWALSNANEVHEVEQRHDENDGNAGLDVEQRDENARDQNQRKEARRPNESPGEPRCLWTLVRLGQSKNVYPLPLHEPHNDEPSVRALQTSKEDAVVRPVHRDQPERDDVYEQLVQELLARQCNRRRVERHIGGHLDAENQDGDHNGEYAVVEGDHPLEWEISRQGFHR